MARSVVAILALMILPGFALAQQQERTHTVVDGDTLWDLAAAYFDDPWAWERIYEANRDRLNDPDVLEPGTVLVIPGATGAVTEVTVVTAEEIEERSGEVEMEPPPEAVPDPAPQEAPRFEGRTVLYPDPPTPGGMADGAGVPRYFQVSADGFWSASWLVADGEAPGRIGSVLDFEGAEEVRAPRYSARPYDRLKVVFEGPTPPVGTRLQSFRVVDDIEGVGDVVQPTGTLTIVERNQAGAVAEVYDEYARLQKGDHVRALPDFPLTDTDHPEPVAGGVESTILGFADRHELQSIGDEAFLGVGRSDGVSLGDEFVVVWSDSPGWSERVEGRLKVVAVQEERSTARIVALENPVFRPGARVRLDRKMR